MKRKPVRFTLPKANPPVCWLCGRRLYGGGRCYVLVRDDGGHEHPAHKLCAQQEGGGW